MLDIVAMAVKDRYPDTLIRKDSVVEPVHLDIHVRNNKADMCVVHRDNKTCVIIEIAVPFDVFISMCYAVKRNKYPPK